MNRAQKRQLAKKTGLHYKIVKKIVEEKEENKGSFLGGEKCMLNTEKIRQHPKFNENNPEYIKFIEESEGKIFTILKEEKYKNSPIVSLEEDVKRPRWLFYEGDVIKKDGDIQ